MEEQKKSIQESEIREAENKLRNQQILTQYYNNIASHKWFESTVLNRDNEESFYINVINNHIEYRNNQLLTIEDLSTKIELLKPFNRLIKEILTEIVWGYSKVVEWKKTNNKLHENNLEIRFSRKLAFLQNDFIRSIEENLICDPLLAFRINEYCLIGFKSMISFLKSNLLINFEESPLYPRFQNLINKYESLVDVEKMKVTANLGKQKIDTELQKNMTNKEIPSKELVNTLNWQGTTLEFSEFTKALIESGFIGKIKNEKEVFEKMKIFFNVDDFDKSDKLKQVRNRTKELTPAITVLEVALTNWIKRKD